LEIIRTKLALYADKWSENESAETSNGPVTDNEGVAS
jgi:hypothetical protein